MAITCQQQHICFSNDIINHLQACIQVSVQSLHDEQHSNAGAVCVGVINYRAVQVDEPLMLGQSPKAKEMGVNITIFQCYGQKSHFLLYSLSTYRKPQESLTTFCIPQVHGSWSR